MSSQSSVASTAAALPASRCIMKASRASFTPSLIESFWQDYHCHHPQLLSLHQEGVHHIDVRTSTVARVMQRIPPPIYSKIYPHLHRQYSVRVPLYAHPQHIKVHKHFVYIYCECGMQSVMVCSLNRDTTTSLGLSLTPFFQKLTPTCTGSKMLWCTHMPIHRIWRC